MNSPPPKPAEKFLTRRVAMKLIRTLYTVVFASALLLSAPVQADTAKKDDIEVKLTQSRISTNAAGVEIRQTAEQIKPGDVIEYRAVYHNTTNHLIKGLQGTLPIPLETAFVANSTLPTGATASLDSTQFAALPLKRKVKLPNGKEEEQAVPLNEYRALRWNLGDLDGGKSATIQARVKVDAASNAAMNSAKEAKMK
jgi:uncharacterized repeat protein (TIGR01451 family)